VRNEGDWFENDEEYIENERSPTNFESSSDEDDELQIPDLSKLNSKA